MNGIRITTTKIEWDRYSIADSGRDLAGPEPSRDEYPAFAIFRELASLGKAGGPGESAAIAVSDLYAYAAAESGDCAKVFYDLGLPDIYAGSAYLEASGSLAARELRLRLWYPKTVSAFGPAGDRGLRREGMLLKAKNSAFAHACGPELYALAEAVERFNDAAAGARALEATLLDIARIKRLADQGNIPYDDILKSERVFEAQTVKLRIVDEGDSVSIRPDLPVEGAPEGAFAEKFARRLSIDAVYNFDAEDGRERVVLPKKTKLALDVLKRDCQRIRDPEKLRAFLENPPPEFDDADLDFSELYSERVKGLGIYRPKTWPFICPYETEWLPGVMVEGVDGKKALLLHDHAELAELEEAIAQGVEQGRDYAEFRGERVGLDAAQAAASAARERFSGTRQAAGEAAERHKVLLIAENIEALEYREGAAEEPLVEAEVEVPGLASSMSLKPHQREGLSRLMALYGAKYPGAILADDMGLGKTIQALGFLEALGRREGGVLACVVAPVSLIGNWMDEYRRCFPSGELLFRSVMGDRQAVRELRDHREKHRNVVALMSYETMRRNQLEVCAVHWDVAILDEAQKIKTPGTLVTNAAKALKADFKLAMTGTPVENTFHDLWCIADFSAPGFLGSASEFAREFNPTKDDDEEAMLRKGEALRSRLGKRFLRRIKEDVLADLPPKYESDDPAQAGRFEGVPTVKEMPAAQRAAYDHVILDYHEMRESGELDGRRGILDVLHRLKSACEHPAFVSGGGEREALAAQDDSAKFQSLLVVLDKVQAAGEKAIVFAEYRRTQRFLAAAIHERYGILPDIVNGETPVGFDAEAAAGTRLGIVKDFNTRTGFDVLIMSPVAAGVGLTVTGANHVIHFSRHWNPSKEDQATDRAYRIGQTKPVYVYYLIARHPDSRVLSFDDNLAKLLFAKRGMRGAVLYPSERVEIRPEDVLEDMSDRLARKEMP